MVLKQPPFPIGGRHVSSAPDLCDQRGPGDRHHAGAARGAARIGPAPAPVAAPDQGQAENFSSAQLDALLAPIALYPDALLTQLLMATTNPLEIVAASRWLAQGRNKDLKGNALENVLEDAAVGSVGQIARSVSAGAGDAQPAARMDPAARLCHAGAAGRRVRRDPAPARKGPGCRQFTVDAAADRADRAAAAPPARSIRASRRS